MANLALSDSLMLGAYEMRQIQKAFTICDLVTGTPVARQGVLERSIGIFESAALTYSGLTPKDFQRRYGAFGSGYGFQPDYEPPRTDAYGENFSY